MASMPPAPGWLGYLIDGGTNLHVHMCIGIPDQHMSPRQRAKERLLELGIPAGDIANLTDRRIKALTKKWRRLVKRKGEMRRRRWMRSARKKPSEAT